MKEWFLKYKVVILLLFLSLFLSWPLLPNLYPFPVSAKSYLNLTLVKITGTSTEWALPGKSVLVGQDVLSQLLGVELFPMPIELCFVNNNEIYDGNSIVATENIYDANEAGAMEFSYDIPGGDNHRVYIKKGDRKCEVMPDRGAVLRKEIIIRKPRPAVLCTPVSEKTFCKPKNYYVKTGRSFVEYHILWSHPLFFKNFFAYLFGLVVLANTCKNFVKNFLDTA